MYHLIPWIGKAFLVSLLFCVLPAVVFAFLSGVPGNAHTRRVIAVISVVVFFPFLVVFPLFLINYFYVLVCVLS